jgi:hypothetical protein
MGAPMHARYIRTIEYRTMIEASEEKVDMIKLALIWSCVPLKVIEKKTKGGPGENMCFPRKMLRFPVPLHPFRKKLCKRWE